ncbi:arylsulfatase J-like isoform X3 [Ornithodoros turicata]|uniref:arylsulfatase J-like isoform X3 n=1 Tax=Ornithodoros turicata TaxID=34597 RepID=UPI003139B008
MNWVQILCLCLLLRNAASRPPNIVFILVDDLGWRDVSYHGSDQIPTPNIDVLAMDGVVLGHNYVQPLGTASRAALLTGFYPVHTGMQHLSIGDTEPRGLGMEFKLLPQFLKDLGYSTHMIGKWHLGFFRDEQKPLRRGFDTFYGIFNGAADFWTHFSRDPTMDLSGHALRSNEVPLLNETGRYLTSLFARQAERIIHSRPRTKPFFLYLAPTAVHCAGSNGTIQAPYEYLSSFSYLKDYDRQMLAGSLAELDKLTMAARRWASPITSPQTGPCVVRRALWQKVEHGVLLSCGRRGSHRAVVSPSSSFTLQTGFLHYTGLLVLSCFHGKTLETPREIPDAVLAEVMATAPVGGYCHPKFATCMYDLNDDPWERYNLYRPDHPEYMRLRARIEEFKQTMKPVTYTGSDPRADPMVHGGVWNAWHD